MITTIPEWCKHFVDNLGFELCQYFMKLKRTGLTYVGMFLYLWKVSILWQAPKRDILIPEKPDYLCKSDFFYLCEFFLSWAPFLQNWVQVLSLFLEGNLLFLRREASVHRQQRRWKRKIHSFSPQCVSWNSDNSLWYLKNLLDHVYCFLCQNLSKERYFIEGD